MRHDVAILASTMLVLQMAAPALAVSDPATVMREIASEPYRYDGVLQGTVPERRFAVDQPPIHLSVGLAAPDARGRLQGEAILFDQHRRLVASAHVSGQIAGGPTAGTAACALHLSLPSEELTLSGVCTASTLSGEIVSQPRSADLLARIVSWWGDDAVAGRYWLTSAGRSPAS